MSHFSSQNAVIVTDSSSFLLVSIQVRTVHNFDPTVFYIPKKQTMQTKMNLTIKNKALLFLLFAASGECFVSNQGGRPIFTPTGTSAPRAFAGVPRFAASSSTVMPPEDDEVTRLKAMATKLREEAANLESEQKLKRFEYKCSVTLR